MVESSFIMALVVKGENWLICLNQYYKYIFKIFKPKIFNEIMKFMLGLQFLSLH